VASRAASDSRFALRIDALDGEAGRKLHIVFPLSGRRAHESRRVARDRVPGRRLCADVWRVRVLAVKRKDHNCWGTLQSTLADHAMTPRKIKATVRVEDRGGARGITLAEAARGEAGKNGDVTRGGENYIGGSDDVNAQFRVAGCGFCGGRRWSVILICVEHDVDSKPVTWSAYAVRRVTGRDAAGRHPNDQSFEVGAEKLSVRTQSLKGRRERCRRTRD